jgi:hypothetical protein
MVEAGGADLVYASRHCDAVSESTRYPGLELHPRRGEKLAYRAYEARDVQESRLVGRDFLLGNTLARVTQKFNCALRETTWNRPAGPGVTG